MAIMAVSCAKSRCRAEWVPAYGVWPYTCSCLYCWQGRSMDAVHPPCHMQMQACLQLWATQQGSHDQKMATAFRQTLDVQNLDCILMNMRHA